MLYNQPFDQPGNPNASFVNGNPGTGTPGSIPSAASIEFPQREIVNLILGTAPLTGVVPSNADLNQLARAIQSGALNYGDDGGTANNYATNLAPVPLAYTKGMLAILKILNDNTGPSVLKLNSLLNKPIINRDGSAISAGTLKAGAIAAFYYDGLRDSFQLVWSTAVAGTGGAVFLTAPRTFFVNASTGSDANDGTTATVTGGHGPFATIQKAANQLALYNLNGYNVTINVADGTYTSASFPVVNGSGQVIIVGNTTTPANCAVAPPAGLGNCAFTFVLGNFFVTGFRLSTALSQNYDCIMMTGGGCYVTIGGKMQFGPAGRSHFFCQNASSLSFDTTATTTITVETGANAISHIVLLAGSTVGVSFPAGAGGWPNIIFLGSVTFSGGFVNSYAGAYMTAVYNVITNAAAVTGPHYAVSMNGVIQSNGNGVNYYPGNSAGLVATGGQYVP